MKNVANELERGGAHQAVRINAKGNVVNGLSAMNGFGNHELFVFAPGKLGRSFGAVGAGIRCRLRRLEQTSEHFMEVVQGGGLRTLLVGGQHRFKTIGRREHNPRKLGAVQAGHLRGQHVFEFVGECAEFVKATGRRIPFQRVDDAANAANHFFVGRPRLEFETGFVESLQQFCGALKEESAQLARAIFGRSAHVVASMR
jgi:hypothetical protein